MTHHIRANALMPGDRLPSETALARNFGVSRSVVREALRALAAIRVVELHVGKRATIAQLDHSPISMLVEHGVQTEQISVQHVYDVRRAIEIRIVALAAMRRREAQASHIRQIARDMRAALTMPERLMELDIAFHAAIAEACGNPVFLLLIGAFGGVTRQTWPVGWRSRTTAESRETMLSVHEKIAEAIADGDPVAATHLMEAHFDESVRALLNGGML